MEFVIAAIVICLGALGASIGRRDAKTAEDEFNAIAPGVKVERQFEPPRHENELL